MPRICYFDGNKHEPPHFHAVYGEYGAVVSIETGEVRRGNLPPRASQLVKEWTEMHRQDLRENWERAGSEQELRKIPPLE